MSGRLKPASTVAAILAVALAAAMAAAPGAAAARRVAPQDGGLDAAILARARALPRLRSVLVSVGGELTEEHYFNGASARRPANLKSASKSIISILVGIAIDQKYLAGVDQPIAGFFPRYFVETKDDDKAAITIDDLLSMRSGLESTSSRNYGAWVQSRDWVRYVLSQPLVAEPGGRMIYSTGSTHLLSAILTKATGMTTLAFARKHLAEPLGIALPAWMRDPQGIYFGGNEMLMTPRDMVKIGELYLRGGALDGARIVPERWVEASFTPRGRSRFSGRQYGYGWWIRQLAGHDVFYAWGYGGQFIFIVPDLDLVVVTTSSPEPGSERRGHLGAIYEMVEEEIIPAVEN